MMSSTQRGSGSDAPLEAEVAERSPAGAEYAFHKPAQFTPIPDSSSQGGSEHAERPRPESGTQANKKTKKRDVHGWIVLDKPVGMTSTHAVSVIKRLFQAKRVGHAGTLDPLASGCLPIALGEATKTVPFVVDSRKNYLFTIRWGEERDTDDAEGRVVATSELRPDAAAIRAQLPRFTGTIEQVPPRFSAVKIGGERAYDLARDGEVVELKARTVEIHRLELRETADADHASLAAECGKGTYVRSIARDLGRALGVFGHVSALRRSRVGPFGETDMIPLEGVEALCHRAAAGEYNLADILLPIETALDDIPALAVSPADAARLKRGQAVLMRGRDASVFRGMVAVACSGEIVAIAEVDRGEIVPKRVFNLTGIVGRSGRKVK
jgi:tRNA pseudouridine55 synthase